MISLYSGTPGSGKSYHIAIYIYRRLSIGRTVLCNFEINSDKIKSKTPGNFIYVNNLELSPNYLIQFSQKYSEEKERRLKEGELLLFIDESQILFNSRDWGQKNRNAWLSFFTQHRKFGYDIILVAQFDRMLDRQIRSLVEYEYIHRKVNNYGKAGKLLGFVCHGGLFVCVKMWYPMKQRLGSEFFMANKKYFAIYDTYNMFTAPG